MQKIVWLLQSRKFWAAIVGLLVALGLLETSEAAEAELVQAIVTVATAFGYMVSVAIEDAGRHVGAGATDAALVDASVSLTEGENRKTA